MTTKKEVERICKNCKAWNETIPDVLGECAFEMETKTANTEACPWFEPKGEG